VLPTPPDSLAPGGAISRRVGRGWVSAQLHPGRVAGPARMAYIALILNQSRVLPPT
jgi:hypothetical protein